MTEKTPFSMELHQRTKDVHDDSDKLINVKLLVALTDTKIYGSVLKVCVFVDHDLFCHLFMLSCHNYLSSHFSR